MIELSEKELALVQRALEHFLEITKKDCDEMPLALETHKKFSCLSGPQSVVIEEEHLANWGVSSENA